MPALLTLVGYLQSGRPAASAGRGDAVELPDAGVLLVVVVLWPGAVLLMVVACSLIVLLAASQHFCLLVVLLLVCAMTPDEDSARRAAAAVNANLRIDMPFWGCGTLGQTQARPGCSPRAKRPFAGRFGFRPYCWFGGEVAGAEGGAGAAGVGAAGAGATGP